MYIYASKGSSDFHLIHVSRTQEGTKSTHLNLASHKCCNSIFAFIMVGENQPITSDTFAT
uniref:Uncharacterized protein n=1 Tax=Amphimedon queenslandica TaxID=400682 RepID=A0A1X7VTG1_AMPQE